jgi:precorrin-8X/cobalt-precorrin-8 methylmutase
VTLFDRYIAVDWSAANERRAGKDSIWIAERGPEGCRSSLNPPTRAEATALLIERIGVARAAGERVMVGFDFVFGYPRGAARAIAGKPGWRAMWDAIVAEIVDDAENHSNRFEVAARFNRVLELEHFWGHPPHHRYADLQPTRPLHDYLHIAEHRLAEAYARRPQPVWKLSGAGSVGSQSLVGIPRLRQLQSEFPEAKIWPFETAFESDLGPLALVEIYPSMFPLSGKLEPKDREQVEVSVTRFAGLDAAGLLAEFLSAPGTLLDNQKRDVLEEEGWIAGVGHEHLLHGVHEVVTPARLAPRLPPRPRPVKLDYVRDPDAIYEKSFTTIRSETDLRRFPLDLQDDVDRMIHACGMTDIVDAIRWGGQLVSEVRFALGDAYPVLCDCEMVRSGISRRHLSKATELVVTLIDPSVPELAEKLETTRSAAAVDLWLKDLEMAIVVIGNAPTALFHLLEMLDGGAPHPAAIIATPVGFVGAEESKALLALDKHKIPFLTLLGRRGGSAIASAAFNAITKGMSA